MFLHMYGRVSDKDGEHSKIRNGRHHHQGVDNAENI